MLKLNKKWFLLLLAPFLWFLIPPKPLFTCDYSKAVLDRNDDLLRLWLTSDEQFRLPPTSTPLPEKYVTAVTTFEDSRFFFHPGFDPLSIAQAAISNVRAGRVVRGGSTITMQLARLVSPQSRTFKAKLSELLRAIRYEIHFSKKEILSQYAAHVPMGGNIVGIEAASFRYFGREMATLTWSEAALLAVLPNAPGMIDISRKRVTLQEKRNRLLKTLYEKQKISLSSYELAMEEPLPERVNQIPFSAPHFTRFVQKRSDKTVVHTTLDPSIQTLLEDEIRRYRYQLQEKGIENCAVLITNHRTHEVLGYVGSQDFFDLSAAGAVDGIQAKRSPGSTLKPLLAAAVLNEGPFSRYSLVQDVPTYYGTFSPRNATRSYDGVVPLEQALIRSLNVPFVRLLNFYGTEQFYYLLNRGGIRFPEPAGHYGLSMILGGAETSLWDLVTIYVSIAGTGTVQPLIFDRQNSPAELTPLFSEGAAGITRSMMTGVVRPGFEKYRHAFSSRSGEIAWKTGTSYGQKDGWAIGISGSYLIGVWTGNFSGEGNASLGGSATAAPLLFSIFTALNDTTSLPELPLNDLEEVTLCVRSGFRAGPYCDSVMTDLVPRGQKIETGCPFHKQYIVDETTGEQLCSACWNGHTRKAISLFALPPTAAQLNRKRGAHIDTIPVHNSSCSAEKQGSAVEILYPSEGIQIVVPRNFDGTKEKLIFSATTSNHTSELFWYCDQKLIGTTENNHKITVDSIEDGEHMLFVQNSHGGSASVSFRTFSGSSL